MLGDQHCDAACNNVLCEYDQLDCVDQTHPLTIYVSPSAVPPLLGNLSHPHLSLAAALSTIPATPTVVFLLPGTHFLAPGTTNIVDPLATVSAPQIFVRTLLCSISQVAGCGSDSAIIQLTAQTVVFSVSTQVTFENIVFTGGFPLKPGCLSATCTYCPVLFLDLKTNLWMNDRGETIDEGQYAEQTLCDVYQNDVLFNVRMDAVLQLTNVTFTNIRHQPRALILSTCGLLQFANVTFSNIMPRQLGLRSGVITWEMDPRKSPYYCGELLYNNGTVEMLNNGYELTPDVSFTGFAYIHCVKLVNITGVQFLYNNMFIGARSTDSSSSLLFIEEFREVHVMYCRFLNNIADVGGGLYLSSSLRIPIINANGISQEHLLTHVHIFQTEFINNTAAIGAAFWVTFLQDHQNVLVENCTLSGNVATKRDTFAVYNAYVTVDFELGKVVKVLDNDVLVNVTIPSTATIFRYLTVANNIGPYLSYNLNIGEFVLMNTSITGNGEVRPGSSLFNSVLENYRYNPSTYSQTIPPDQMDFQCISLVFLSNVYHLNITNSGFINGYCPFGSPGFTVDQGLNIVHFT